MNAIKILLGILYILMIIGCVKAPQQFEYCSNPAIELELVFEKDGCKVYRFYDKSHYVYYTDCRGKVESVYQTGGKTSHEERVQNETIH